MRSNKLFCFVNKMSREFWLVPMIDLWCNLVDNEFKQSVFFWFKSSMHITNSTVLTGLASSQSHSFRYVVDSLPRTTKLNGGYCFKTVFTTWNTQIEISEYRRIRPKMTRSWPDAKLGILTSCILIPLRRWSEELREVFFTSKRRLDTSAGVRRMSTNVNCDCKMPRTDRRSSEGVKRHVCQHNYKLIYIGPCAYCS